MFSGIWSAIEGNKTCFWVLFTLRTIGSVSASMELALAALVFWLSAILDAMAFGSTVETLVVSWRGVSFTLSLLLFIPHKGADVFFGFRSEPDLCCLYLVESFTRTGFLPCSRVHVIRFQVGANFSYGHERSVVVAGASTHREELVVDSRVHVVFQIPNCCAVVSFGIVLEFHELCNESDHGHVVGLFELL